MRKYECIYACVHTRESEGVCVSHPVIALTLYVHVACVFDCPRALQHCGLGLVANH